MKNKWGCILLGLICVIAFACSSDHDEVIPEEPEVSELTEVSLVVKTEHPDSILYGDSISQEYEVNQSRSWSNAMKIPAMYLISDADGQRHSLKLGLSESSNGIDWVIRFCLSVNKGTVYASYGSQSIPLQHDCMLATVPGAMATSVSNDQVTTPNGKPVDEPFGDELFGSDRFTVGYQTKQGFGGVSYSYDVNYQNQTYNNKSGIFKTSSWRGETLTFKMFRYSTRIRTNLVLIDWNLSILGGFLRKDDFERYTGTKLERWTFQTYLTNTPDAYDVIKEGYPKGNKIVALMKKPIAMEDGQITILDGALFYSGIGKVFEGSEGYVHVLPMTVRGAKLCYSFYFNSKGIRKPKYREFNTLEIPLKDISLDPNVENEITTYFYIDDLITAMSKSNKNEESRSCRENADFGVIMEVPYKFKITHRKVQKN